MKFKHLPESGGGASPVRTRLRCHFPVLPGKYREFLQSRAVLGFDGDIICCKNSTLRADFPKNCNREVKLLSRELFLQIREIDSWSRDLVIHH